MSSDEISPIQEYCRRECKWSRDFCSVITMLKNQNMAVYTDKNVVQINI